LNPALHRLIEAIRGDHFVRCGMVSFFEQKLTSSKSDLLSSFQRPNPTRNRCSFVVLSGVVPSRDAAYTGSVFCRQLGSKKNPSRLRPPLYPFEPSRFFQPFLDEDLAMRAPSPIAAAGLLIPRARFVANGRARPSCSSANHCNLWP